MTLRNAAPAASEPLRIVAIGGGTGLSTLLHGLKVFKNCSSTNGTVSASPEITAIVTVTDDGGSSGRLRRDFDVLPPGDIRSCLVALSEDEALLAQLFKYRFQAGKGLKGHSFGNLFLTALTHLTGDFPQAVRLASEVLATCGRIYPATAANVVLEATLADKTVVTGESRISRSRARIQRVKLKPSRCKPLPETLEAIAAADLITFGPGSLFTSVIPNLLVKGIPEAIAASRATKAYFVNLMWQPGETLQFTAADHVTAIHEHAGRRLIDCAIINTRPITAPLQQKYAAKEARPVENDLDRLAELGVKVVAREFVLESEKVRHNPDVIAEVAIHLAGEARGGRSHSKKQWKKK
jgi:uncharacterized cofD-like protein